MKRPEYYFFAALSRVLGEKGAEALARAGVQALLASPEKRANISRNLGRVLSFRGKPAPSPAEVEEKISELARHYARYLCTMAGVQRDYRVYLEQTDEVLLPILKALLARGKGAVLVAPHLGFTNLLMGKLPHLGIKLTVLMVNAAPYRLDPGVLDNLRMLDAVESAADCMRALAGNEAVLVNGDVDYFPEGRTAPFFGAPFPPPHGAVRLAEAAGAPLLPVHVPLENDRYRLLCDEPIPPDLGMEEKEALLLRAMERAISAHPTQWFVFHDPWDLPAAAERARRQLEQLRAARKLKSYLGN